MSFEKASSMGGKGVLELILIINSALNQVRAVGWEEKEPASGFPSPWPRRRFYGWLQRFAKRFRVSRLTTVPGANSGIGTFWTLKRPILYFSRQCLGLRFVISGYW